MLVFKDYPDIVKTFLEIVPIYNASKEEDQLVLWLVDQLTTLNVDSILQDNFGNVIAHINSNITGNKNTIMFIAHLDSVMPCNNIVYSINKFENDYKISSSGNTILSADDKVGVASIVEAIKYIKKENIPYPNIELVFTVQEEIGLLGAKALNHDQFNSKIAFALDAEAPVGTIITQGPYQKRFTIDFYGKGAHAGISPENGISSIKLACEFLNNISIGRIDPATTSNIGVIKGGSATNVVPEFTSLMGEIRSLYEMKLDGIINAYKLEAQKALEKFPGSSYEFNDEITYYGYFIDINEPVIQLSIKACENIGIDPILTSIGSGSDANIINHEGVKTVVLGVGFKDSHSLDESITFSQLTLLKNLIINILKEYV